jgi:hypothetical protein
MASRPSGEDEPASEAGALAVEIAWLRVAEPRPDSHRGFLASTSGAKRHRTLTERLARAAPLHHLPPSGSAPGVPGLVKRRVTSAGPRRFSFLSRKVAVAGS